MPAAGPKNIDEYFAGLPPETRRILEQIRTVIRETVPEAEEKISYGMPAFTLGGRYLIYMAAYKKHIGVYPVPEGNKDFEKDFAHYKTSGKGTIQFPLNKPIPYELITRIVKYRVSVNPARAAEKKK